MERASKNVRLGLTMPLGGAGTAVETARFARDKGFEELWLAEVNGGDAYAGIDGCVDKLERQLSDHKKKFRNRKHAIGEDKRSMRGAAGSESA